jgi:hypothetical protein
MAKYKYIAQVDCKRGNTISSKQLEFIADEKSFEGTSAIKDLNKVALRFVKSQNGGQISGYQKVEVRGYSKRQKIEANRNSSSRSSSSSSSSSKKGGIFRIFVRIISKIFGLIDKLLR